MYILKPIDTEQRISFLGREGIIGTAIACFRDDQTNEKVCVRLPGLLWNTNDDNWEEADYDWESNIGVEEPTETNDFETLIMEFEYYPSFLKEGHFYDLEIYNADNPKDVYFKDRVFVTAQTVEQLQGNYYEINKGEYKNVQTENEDFKKRNDYIVL